MYSVKKKKNLTIGFDDFANSQNQRVHTPGELVASLLFTRLCWNVWIVVHFILFSTRRFYDVWQSGQERVRDCDVRLKVGKKNPN